MQEKSKRKPSQQAYLQRSSSQALEDTLPLPPTSLGKRRSSPGCLRRLPSESSTGACPSPSTSASMIRWMTFGESWAASTGTHSPSPAASWTSSWTWNLTTLTGRPRISSLPTSRRPDHQEGQGGWLSHHLHRWLHLQDPLQSVFQTESDCYIWTHWSGPYLDTRFREGLDIPATLLDTW